MPERKDYIIMAPVGSYESLMAAIQAKADAVYFGIGKLNMRSKSSLNFTFDDLSKIVSLCKSHAIKTYLTINTVMYDEDLQLMKELIDAAKINGIDAVILSDQAALLYAFEKGVEVHLSTQINISNIESLKFYAPYADVVVLARELNIEQVKNIYESIQSENIRGPKGELIKIEMFVHGALCMAVSGKCYLSLHEYNSSANRGACLQICRRGYEVTDKETGAQFEIDNEYIMSPKDLCTIDFLDKLSDAGVRVFKIEGRARSAEYVKTVVSCYNQATEAIANGTYDATKAAAWKEKLRTVFNRDFWDGYYLGRRLGEWSNTYGSKASKKKVYVGKISNYFSKLGVAEVSMETGELQLGDEIIIMGPTTGVIEMTIPEIRVDLKPVEKTMKGEKFSFPVESTMRRSDKVFKLV